MQRPPALLAVLLLAAGPAAAQISISATAEPVTETFDDFRGAGFQPEPAAGQLDSDNFLVRGTSDNTGADFGLTATTGDFARGTSNGGVSTGGVYAFRTAPGDYSLGLQPTDADFDGGGVVAARYRNDTGVTIRSLVVSFEIKVVNDQDRASIFDFYYATADSAGGGTFPSLDSRRRFVSRVALSTPTTADAAPAWATTAHSVEIGQLDIGPGDYIMLAFLTSDNFANTGTGTGRDELALDDLSLTASDVVLPDVTVSQTIGDEAGPGNDAGWRMLAAPVEGVTLGDLAAVNLVQGIEDSYPDEETNLYVDYDGSGSPLGFANPAGTSTTTTLEAGRGFLWYFYDEAFTPGGSPGTSSSVELPAPYATSNTPRQGDVTTDFGGLNDDGFYFGGNPFEEGLQLSGISVTRYGGVLDAVQVWNPSAQPAPTYEVLSRVSGAVAAPAQGFMLEIGGTVFQGLRVQVTYPASARTTGGTFYGLTDGPVADGGGGDLRHLRFEMEGAIGGTPTLDRAAVLLFAPNATDEWDVYEGSKLIPIADTFATIAFVGDQFGDVQRRAQESRPTDPETFTVPLALLLRGGGGTFTLRWPAMENIPAEWGLELSDLVTGETVNLEVDSTYTFTADAAPGWTERFVLAVLPFIDATEGDAPLTAHLSEVAPNPAGAAARLTLTTQVPEEVRVEVLDVLGRRVAVLHEGLLAAGTHGLAVETAGLPSGTYVVRATSPTFAAVRRFTVIR